MGRLSGKVAIITGASQGMGEAHAKAFVAEGASVILTDLNAVAGEALAEALAIQAMFVKQDVASDTGWAELFAAGEVRFGLATVLVNNTGTIGTIAKTTDLSAADFAHACAVNQTSVFLGTRTVLAAMIAGGGGSNINIYSTSGMIVNVVKPNLAYAGSKFAVRGMTKQVAVEYGGQNIRANSVRPGYVKNPIMVAATDKDGGGVAAGIPLGHFLPSLRRSRHRWRSPPRTNRRSSMAPSMSSMAA